DGVGAALAEAHVVGVGIAGVGVAVDLQLDTGVTLEEFRGNADDVLELRLDHGLVRVEVDGRQTPAATIIDGDPAGGARTIIVFIADAVFVGVDADGFGHEVAVHEHGSDEGLHAFAGGDGAAGDLEAAV